MATFILAFLFFILAVAAMAVGVIVSNKPIVGSCGGMGALGIDTGCDICGGDAELCKEESRTTPEAGEDLFYSAANKS